jgi:predicted transcriptional regulator of viral defense system
MIAPGSEPMMDILRASVPFEEFDYQTLTQALRQYAHPRDRATRLLETGAIVRVKKGLYVFGPAFRRQPYSAELLANLISGPSYVSFEHALSYYGLIPERVETITCATFGKSRTFTTPVGRFTYRPVPRHVFWIGVTLADIGADRAVLMARREKALCDTVVVSRRLAGRSRRALRNSLADDLRLDMDQLATLDAAVVADLALRWPSRRLEHLAEVIAHE